MTVGTQEIHALDGQAPLTSGLDNWVPTGYYAEGNIRSQAAARTLAGTSSKAWGNGLRGLVLLPRSGFGTRAGRGDEIKQTHEA
jgi:hypothetical protein